MINENQLYPVFLKVSQLQILIIGGGAVGHEKLHFLLKSSPSAQVEVLSSEFLPETRALAEKYGLKITRSKYRKKHLRKRHIVIAATNDPRLNHKIHAHAKKRNLLVNVADTPELCDFYMGGIVTKGQVKLAISTNGRSPTTAKRLREFFEEVIPENINIMVDNLAEFRSSLKGDFQQKVNHMNQITESLKTKRKDQ